MWKRKRQLPPRIAETVRRLKAEYGFYITARRINNGFYLYKEWKVWDGGSKRQRLKVEYLGRVDDDGTFRKSASGSRLNLENARRLIESLGGEVTMPEQPEGADIGRLDTADGRILTCLSMNARLPVPKIALLSDLNEQTAYSRIKSLERRLGITYISEINTTALGYAMYLLLIKFEESIPTLQELKDAIVPNSKIQFAAELKGEYDLVMYILDEDPIKAEDNLWEFRSSTALGAYKAAWYLTPFGQTYSFVPLRSEFIDDILKTAVWGKAKKSGSSPQRRLKQREFLVLKELNGNSIEDFASIDKRYGLGMGGSRYAYHKLIEDGIIVRPTVTVNLSMKYLGIILMETMNASETRETRHRLLFDTIEYGQLCNKYSLTGNIGSPEGLICFMPVVNQEDLDNEIEHLQESVKGMIFRTLIVTNIIVGSLCHRRFDNHYSRQYEILAGLKKIEPEKAISYS